MEIDPEFADAERAMLIGLVEQAKRVTRKRVEQAEQCNISSAAMRLGYWFPLPCLKPGSMASTASF